jgi:quinol monooxygenase YgiN
VSSIHPWEHPHDRHHRRPWKILPHLKALIDATRAHDGCIAYDVAEDPWDRGLFRYTELWPDQESLTAHLKAPHIAPWRAAAGAFVLERKFTVYDLSGERPL